MVIFRKGLFRTYLILNLLTLPFYLWFSNHITFTAMETTHHQPGPNLTVMADGNSVLLNQNRSAVHRSKMHQFESLPYLSIGASYVNRASIYLASQAFQLPPQGRKLQIYFSSLQLDGG